MSAENLKVLMRWNNFWKFLLKSYRQQFSFQKSKCFPACFENHLFISTSNLIWKEIKDEGLDAEKRFEGWK